MKNQKFRMKEILLGIFIKWLPVMIPLALNFDQEYISEIDREPLYSWIMKDLLESIACWNLNEISFFERLNSPFNKSISCQPSRSLVLTSSTFWTFPFVTSFTNLNQTFLTKIMAALICKSYWCCEKIWILIR